MTVTRSLRHILLLGAALAMLGAVAAAPGSAADSARAAALERRLQDEADRLARSRFERVDSGTVEAARKGEPSVTPIGLDGGVTYAMIAACGEGCDHVELALFDPAQKLVHRSPEKKDVVIIRGPAPQSGAYGIVVSVPGCRVAGCPAGFVVLKQAPRPDGAKPDAARSASAAPADLQDDARAMAELAKLAVTPRDAARARERMAAPVVAPEATDAGTAPGRPSAVKR
jgi:hypothetical protein